MPNKRKRTTRVSNDSPKSPTPQSEDKPDNESTAERSPGMNHVALLSAVSEVLKLVTEDLQDHSSQSQDGTLTTTRPSRPRKHQPEMFKTVTTFREFLFISGILNFKQEVVNQLVAASLTNERFAAEAQDLYRRLRRIHANVQAHTSRAMRARWIMNTVLESLIEVGSSDGTPNEQGYDTFIIPGMLVNSPHNVDMTLKNHAAGPSILFDDFTTDYCVLKYPDNFKNKATGGYPNILAGMDKFMYTAMLQAAIKDTGTFILVELSDPGEIDGLKMAHSTAVKAALLGQVMGESPIRYCVSDGRSWHFAYVQLSTDGSGEQRWVTRGIQPQLKLTSEECSPDDVVKLLVLLKEWMSPTTTFDELFDVRIVRSLQ